MAYENENIVVQRIISNVVCKNILKFCDNVLQLIKKLDRSKNLKLSRLLNLRTWVLLVSTAAQDLGIIFYSTPSLDTHTNDIFKLAHHCLLDLYHFRKFLNIFALMLLVNVLVSSHLNYCSMLLFAVFGIYKSNLDQLEGVQNTLALVVSKQWHSNGLCKLCNGAQRTLVVRGSLTASRVCFTFKIFRL